MFETRTSTVPITKEMVKAAYRKVKANHGAAGIDKESLEMYQEDLFNNLYVLWNRLSSGSYFLKPLRSLSIPKNDGKRRTLGIPTVSDRIAQQVIKTYLEPRLEAEFDKEIINIGNKFSKEVVKMLSEIKKGDTVIFKSIYGKSVYGELKEFDPLVFFCY